MKRITSIALTLCALLCASCSKEFFEQYPSNSITENNFYQTDDDFNQAVRGCYQSLYSESGFFINELGYRSDESYCYDMTSGNQERYGIDHFEEQTTFGMFEDLWGAWYKGIDRCNDVLTHMAASNLKFSYPYEAEAKFLRAWYYFNLYRTFGTVPLVDKVVSASDAKTIKRCTDAEMLSFIEKDLKLASDSLPDARPAEAIRATKMAAKALLAKVYLTFGDAAKAETILSGLQEDSNYGLMSTTAEAFDINNKLNKEMIFFLYYDASTGDGHGLWWSVSSLENIQYPNRDYIARTYSDSDNRKALINEYQKITKTNYAMNKWYAPFDATYTTSVSNDFPFIRYADVVLMMAEALGTQNKIAEALPYLNQTRTRAGLPALTTAEVTSKEVFVKELADERAREFMLEGQRWYDLVRLDLAISTFKEIGQDIDSHNLVFPIPYSEIQIVGDNSILWQNPGY